MLAAMETTQVFCAALAVWAGYYGNGDERRQKLKADGYDPDQVQEIVNMLAKVFKKCEEYSYEF